MAFSPWEKFRIFPVDKKAVSGLWRTAARRAGRQKPAAWKARATPGRGSGGFPKSRAILGSGVRLRRVSKNRATWATGGRPRWVSKKPRITGPGTRPRLAFGGRFGRVSSGWALWGSHFGRGSIRHPVWRFRWGAAAKQGTECRRPGVRARVAFGKAQAAGSTAASCSFSGSFWTCRFQLAAHLPAFPSGHFRRSRSQNRAQNENGRDGPYSLASFQNPVAGQ